MRPMLILLLLMLATPALAVDGVLEINQTCAVQTGCFSGDTKGWPVTINGTAGKSYRLTSSLYVPDRNTTAITITRQNTSVDLNGFEIGLFACQGFSCLPLAGTGDGVSAPGVRGVSIRNGSITATGRWGVDLGDEAEVSNLRVRWNGAGGIRVRDKAQARKNTISNNGVNTSTNGLHAESFALIVGNVVSGSSGAGIRTGIGSTVSGNTVYGSTLRGILTDDRCTVMDNTSTENGGFGIVAGNSSTVQGNTVGLNGSAGLFLGSTTAYRGNTIDSNGLTVTGGVNAGGNVCNGSLTCP